MNDPTTSEGHLSDSHGMDVGTLHRDRRFKRRLNSCVQQVLQKTIGTDAEAYCREPTTAAPVSQQPTSARTLDDDQFIWGANAAFLCHNEPAKDKDLAKAERRIAHALKTAPRLYEPSRDGAKLAGPADKGKYVAPKYENLDSLLRYVESDSGQGAVKVVIMNFND